MIDLAPVTRRIYSLIAVLAFVAFTVSAASLLLLYQTAISQQRQRLVDVARSNALLVEAIHHGAVASGRREPMDAIVAELGELEAHQRAIGATGELAIAHSEDDQPVFIMSQRHPRAGSPQHVPERTEIAEPMRRALAGESGSMIGADCRGETVLAGYAPVAELGLGVVAKIDLAEVRSPFLRTGLIASAAFLALLLAGIMASVRMGGTVIKRLHDSRTLVEHIAASAPLLIAYVDAGLRFRFVNQEYERWSGRPARSIIGRTVHEVFGDEGYAILQDRIRLVLAGERVSFETCLPLPDGRTPYLQARYVPHRTESGDTVGFVVVTEDITARRAAEAALRRSEETNRLAMQVTTDGLWDWNMETGEVYFSPAWGRILGEDEVRPEYGYWEERLHPEDRPEVMRTLAEHLDGKTSRWELEHRLRTRGGSWKWVLGRGKVVARDADGAPKRMLGTMIDISKRKEAENRLRESEARFRSLTSLGPAGIFMTDAEGNCIYVNERWQEMSGLTAEQARGSGWIQGLHPDDRAFIDTDWHKQVEVEGPWQFEYRFCDRKGRITWVYSTAQPIVANDGEVKGWVGVNTDITALKTAETELRRERDFSRSLIETAQVIILVLDPSGHIASFNAYMEQVSGFRLDEVAGSDWFTTFLPEHDHERIREIFLETVERGEIRGNINPIITKQGQLRDIEWFARTLRNEDGELTGVLAVGQDVTDRLVLEERLRHAEKMDAIGQLAGGIAHDFNNQLGAILGYAELLAEQLHDPGLRGYAEAIAQAAARSGELTNELLAFARKAPHRKIPVNIHQTIGEVILLLQRTIDRKITIRTTLAATRPVVLGDPAHLEAALLNLAINSRDAMPEGGEIHFATDEVTLEQCDELAGGGYLAVSVSDTGVGMDERTQTRAFEPFFTTKRTGSGTGMGLAMVYGTIASHGGRVELSSHLGKGTVVTLCLPLAPEDGDEEGAQQMAVDDLPAAHVLVVEDEPGMRRMLEDTMQNLGLKVTVHEDGLAALEHFTHHKDEFDVVILDLDMPRLDGVQTLKEMRKINPLVKVVLSSGHGAKRKLDVLMDARTTFLPKPYRLSSLREHLRSMIDRD